MEFKEKLRFVMNKYSITAIDLSKRLGVQRSNISHLLSGRNKPSVDFIVKLRHCFPDLGYEWLMEEESVEESPSVTNVNIENENFEQQFEQADNLIDSTINRPIVKDEPKVHYQSSIQNKVEIEQPTPSSSSEKKVVKMMFFYSDGSFEIFDKNISSMM